MKTIELTQDKVALVDDAVAAHKEAEQKYFTHSPEQSNV